MSSRDPSLLDPELRRRIHCTIRDYKAAFPDGPVPFVTCTVRTNAEQAEVWAQGRTKPGKIVTWAEPGQSAHNVNPAMAVDLAFKSKTGGCDWSDALFNKIGRIAQRYGIEWGGDWCRPSRYQDLCHFQVPGWRAGHKPDPWPPMPKEETCPQC